MFNIFFWQAPGPAVDWNTLLGEKMNLKILELDEEKDRLVLSNRKNNFATKKQMNVSAPSLCRTKHRLVLQHGAVLGFPNAGRILT